MKRTKFLCKGMAFAVGITAMVWMSGCQDEHNLFDPNYKTEVYNSVWEQTFGEIDPNQTWNMATQVTANVNGLSGECTVKVYTSNPANEGARLLAKGVMDGSGTMSFDALQSATSLFVTAENETGKVINGYYAVQNGQLTVGNGGTKVAGIDKEISYNGVGNFYTLTDVDADTVGIFTWSVQDFLPILGKDGYFEEGKNNMKWITNDILDRDVVYTINNEVGEIDLILSYYNTSGLDVFGYFYYVGDTPTDISAINKYVLINNIKQNWLWIKYGNEGWNEWEAAGDNLQDINNDWMSDAYYKGTKFHLTYFDEDGNASYTFPVGTKIGFFVINGSANLYSISSLNSDGNSYAVTYMYNGIEILGFEDCNDFDFNDVMFFAIGDFDKSEDINPQPEPEVQSWILACEDLGDVDDFDFNDIVFSVSNSIDNQVTVTPLAAGGTLSARVLYNNSDVFGEEFHTLFGKASSQITNTYADTLIDASDKAKTITVADGFSLSSTDWGGFAIQVEGETATVIVPPGKGKAPQMICIPDADWQWPTERTNIGKAYPEFGEWGSDYQTNTEWYKSPVSDNVVAR